MVMYTSLGYIFIVCSLFNYALPNFHSILLYLYCWIVMTSYKNMPVIRTLARFTESFVFYSIEFFADIRTFHVGYKNMPDIRTLYWKTVAIYHIYFMPVIRTCSYTVNIAHKNILDIRTIIWKRFSNTHT